MSILLSTGHDGQVVLQGQVGIGDGLCLARPSWHRPTRSPLTKGCQAARDYRNGEIDMSRRIDQVQLVAIGPRLMIDGNGVHLNLVMPRSRSRSMPSKTFGHGNLSSSGDSRAGLNQKKVESAKRAFSMQSICAMMEKFLMRRVVSHDLPRIMKLGW